MEITSFELFSDITEEENTQLEERRHRWNQSLANKIASIATQPNKKTLTEKRLQFKYYESQGKYLNPVLKKGVLTREECDEVLSLCSTSTEWTKERHSAFPTIDIPIRHNPSLQYLESLVKSRLFTAISTHYGFEEHDIDFRDIFLVKYSMDAQQGLTLHTDGCLFSITLLISHEDDFEGGGTYYASIDSILHLNQGDCAYHAGNVMHSGVNIRRGERYILVGFIDTVDTLEKDNSRIGRSSN
ncbi:hypothetical protein BDB01DRAFT_830892 [Pilobolus umbonatus]|nr:hypothetical protein BDB01DRAFT_830892 [Pilobolus umbonatus]